MLVGIVADTHDATDRTRRAMDLFMERDVQAVFHCGDIIDEPIIEICSQLPLHFVFGNHDADMTRILSDAAFACGATCLNWRGVVSLAGKTIAMAHGHLTFDLQPLLAENPDYLFSGHFHEKRDWIEGSTRRIVPGALFRANTFSVATLNLESEELRFIDLE